MKITFSSHGWADHQSWVGDRRMLTRINRLITEAASDPAVGAGKPERLSGNLAAYWARRIDHEHRLVYTMVDDQLIVVQARYHY